VVRGLRWGGMEGVFINILYLFPLSPSDLVLTLWVVRGGRRIFFSIKLYFISFFGKVFIIET
jgi:hypothetical protein